MSYSRSGGFRGRRLVQGDSAVYHVVSRTAFARCVFDAVEKERFLRILKRQAGFCGVEVLAFCVMSNHFHLLVRVPEAGPISDGELLRRYRLLLYGGGPARRPRRVRRFWKVCFVPMRERARSYVFAFWRGCTIWPPLCVS